MVSYLLVMMDDKDIARLYAGFHSPISVLDCGGKCSPYNDRGVPFCCDTSLMVPTAYRSEWEFLQTHTDLWHQWQGRTEAETKRLQDMTPVNQVLIECKGHLLCQREFRSISCRAFPFFPYHSGDGRFLGLSYYWEYEDRCWVISNLDVITTNYLREFISAYEIVLRSFPDEEKNFIYHSQVMRKKYKKQGRTIVLLHRNRSYYKISPHNERKRRIKPEQLPKFGNYKLSAALPFSDER